MLTGSKTCGVLAEIVIALLKDIMQVGCYVKR